MAVNRRRFLVSAGMSLVAGSLTPARSAAPPEPRPQGTGDLQDWSTVRDQFNLSRDYVHLSTFYISSHPRPVREAIDQYRRALDENPFRVVEQGMFDTETEHIPAKVKAAVADYLGGKPEEIALTGSTTMGLALVYNGLRIKPGQEILTTVHDHYSHHEAIRLATEKSGATYRKIALFESFDSISEDAIVERIRRAVRPNTRAVGITWVHSSTGLKLPIRRIAQGIQEANAGRSDSDRVLLIVDGVHGLGVEDETVAEMGCDFFAAGTHKWMFGPRGTGILWARDATWGAMRPTVPSFEALDVYTAWTRDEAPSPPTHAPWVSPGGFHAYEHQWAVPAAFRFHQQIGRKRIADRIHALNDQCKEGLARMPHVTLYTPRGSRLSAGIVCFDVRGMSPDQVVRRLLDRRIIASTTPYGVSYARGAPSILNTPTEVDTFLREVRALAAS